MSAEFILEIGVEEIPARFLSRAIDDLQGAAQKFFDGMGLQVVVEKGFTPRRLAVWATGIPLMTPRTSRTVYGPPKDVAVNASGDFTPAAEGFAKRAGKAMSDMRWFVDGKGREVLGYLEDTGGEATAEKLAESIASWITGIHFDKTMRWEQSGARFARPIRWIVARLGEGVVPVKVGDVVSGKMTQGHRFFGKAFEVTSIQGYLEGLLANRVILQVDERRKRIVEGLDEAVTKAMLVAPSIDVQAVLEEVTNLVEWPVIAIGSFDEALLELPEPVVLAPLRGHQRYISLRLPTGKLANKFAIVTNYPGDRMDNVIAGNQRVLRARLSDAKFFFESDVKKPLADMTKGLSDVMFHKELGTYADKTIRVARLAEELVKAVGTALKVDSTILAHSAELSRADLLSSMVGEFPELQGVMGGIYARRQGLSDGVAQAIEDFYLPAGGQFDSPRTVEGRLMALADRLDTLAGYFSIGQVPTGAKDPFALRRAARGAVLICEALAADQNIWLDLKPLLEFSISKQPKADKKTRPRDETLVSIGEFIAQRVESIGVERYPDVGTIFFRAVSSGRPFSPAATLHLARAAAKAAAAKPSQWERLLDADKRMRNITRGVSGAAGDVTLDLLHPAAQDLWRASSDRLGSVGGDDGKALDTALENLYSLTELIDSFFTQVMVNDADPKIKGNNLSMLVQVRHLFGKILNFDVIVG